MEAHWGLQLEPHSLLTWHCMDMSGLLQTPAALSQGHNPGIRWWRGWKDPTIWLDIFENPIYWQNL